jgi:hypothetical protein
MELKTIYTATAAALLAFSTATFAQTQSGSSIRSDSGMAGSDPPSTGTSADTAGSAATTAPRSSDTTTSTGTTSVGTSGATSGTTMDQRSSGLCDTLIGEERTKCLKAQATTGTAGGASTGTTGAGSTGMGSGTK